MENEGTPHISVCLSDEDIACWQSGLVPSGQSVRIGGHLKECARCRGLVAALAAVAVQQEGEGVVQAPAQLTERARNLMQGSGLERIMDAAVTIADGLYRSVETTGQVLFAPWLPAAVALRGPEALAGGTIVLEATRGTTRCRLELSRQDGGRHNVSAVLHDVKLGRPVNGVQCVLYLDEAEVESQTVREGRALFEDLLPGHYRMEFSAGGGPVRELTLCLVTV